VTTSSNGNADPSITADDGTPPSKHVGRYSS
jgi:hypothetical protein